MVKNPAANAGEAASVPGLGRCPGGGLGKPSTILAPGESHGRRSLACYIVHGVQECQTCLND